MRHPIARVLPKLLMLLIPAAGLLSGAARVEAAVTAQITSNQLVVNGDAADDQITLQLFPFDDRDIVVLHGTTTVGTFRRTLFTSILVRGGSGRDRIVLSRTFGPITERATIMGESGDDTISGGAGADVLDGGPGQDRIIWNAGDGVDEVTGGDGVDVMEVNGSSAADRISVEPGGILLPTFLVRRFGVTVVTVENVDVLVVNLLGGNDEFDGTTFLFGTALQLTVNGGDGNDQLVGSEGREQLHGGNGDDTLIGGRGNDGLFGEAGSDVFRCGVLDGSDSVEGGQDTDAILIEGSVLSDQVTITRSGTRARLADSLTGATFELDAIEVIGVNTGDGNDQVTGADDLTAAGVESLVVDGGPGNDNLTGGDTDDILQGGLDDDVVLGSDGNDQLAGGPGVNSLFGGDGNDTFSWDPNDGNLAILGQSGIDELIVLGGRPAGDVIAVTNPSTMGGGDFVVRRGTGEEAVVADIERLVVSPGEGGDTISVRTAVPGVDMHVDGGEGQDVITVTADAIVTVAGAEGVDELSFDALNRPVSVTPTTIASGGVTRVTHGTVESVTFRNLLSALPTIEITGPTADPAATATTPFLAMAGTVADANGIASVTVANNRGGISTATTRAGATGGAFAWTAAAVPLLAGANVLTATVRDTTGNEASDTLTITVDAFTYTLAEGATGAFFDTDILLANPNADAAPVSITYLRGDGTTVGQTMTLAPTSRTTISVDGIAGLDGTDVSATVTSTAALPLVVERTMRWDATGYGAHTEKATEGPATTWLFAEGSQGFFDTYMLLANPGPLENTATVTFLLENGPPVVKSFTLAPTSRRTIQVNAIPELANQSFGVVVTFTQPGVAERAMYFGSPVFNAGHESAGVNAPSTTWFLAEGATGSFFTTFVLLANPGTAPANATVTFLPDSGVAVTKTKVVPAGGRVTLNIAAEDPSLASSPVATAVQSTEPILVERAQYWPFTPDRWHEAHNAFGSTAIGETWGFAEGRVGGPENYQTYILLANADAAQAAQVRITFLRTDGTTVVKMFTVNPTSRLNVQVNSLPELSNESFGALIEVRDGPGIFAERALYSDAQGVVFAAGTNAVATRLPRIIRN